MAFPRNSNYTGYTALQASGAAETINAQAIVGVLADGNGDLLFCTGLVVPTDGGTGYAKGCIFIDTDVATGTTGFNVNKGTKTACAFTAVTQA